MTASLDTRAARALLGKLDELNLGDKFPAEARTSLDRSAALTEAARQQEDDRFRRAHAEVVAGLADGSLTAAEAQKRLVDEHAHSDVANLTKQALTDAAAHAGRKAGSLLIERGEELITDVFAPEGERVIALATAALDHLPASVDTAEAAILAGTKASKAWAQLADANLRWGRLVELLKSLRFDRILEGNSSDMFLYFGKPDLAGRLALSDAIRRGADPRIVTEAQAVAEVEELKRAAAEKRTAAQPQHRNSGSRWSSALEPGNRQVIEELAAQVERSAADA